MKKLFESTYHRYHIEAKKAPHLVAHPNRFQVKVSRLGLAKLLIKELLHHKGKLDVVTSRPCMYGVFSGPIGGFAPRESLCVGCLRCTTEHPDMVRVLKNPKRNTLGDHYFTPDHVDTVVHEAENGRVPIKGAGYRGPFGGTGWDGMWTDMSEIVRPTRDGIHGREFISTVVDIGGKPDRLQFNSQLKQVGPTPQTISIPIPILFDALPVQTNVCSTIVNKAARQLRTFSVFPLKTILKQGLKGQHIVPIIAHRDVHAFSKAKLEPKMIEMDGFDLKVLSHLQKHHSETVLILRCDFEANLMEAFEKGIRVFHLVADHHGRGKSGAFVLDMIRKAHLAFVQHGVREEVTLIGSGGIIAAEHLAKAIICGLDAVALDTPLLVALQARFVKNGFRLPFFLKVEWGRQRLKNLCCSWHDQLLEILGAMGIREVRRMRGEMGRAMFQKELEKEAFSGIVGYE